MSKSEAEEKEIELISKYKTTSIEYGYNVENGGNSLGKHGIETKMKISKANKGKPKSDITKQKISRAKTGRPVSKEARSRLKEIASKPKSEIGKLHIREAKLGSKNPMYGKHLSEETIRKIQLSKCVKKVIQYSLDGNIIKVWNSTYEASKILNINLKNIRRSCVTKYNAGGYKFKYVS